MVCEIFKGLGVERTLERSKCFNINTIFYIYIIVIPPYWFHFCVIAYQDNFTLESAIKLALLSSLLWSLAKAKQ